MVPIERLTLRLKHAVLSSDVVQRASSRVRFGALRLFEGSRDPCPCASAPLSVLGWWDAPDLRSEPRMGLEINGPMPGFGSRPTASASRGAAVVSSRATLAFRIPRTRCWLGGDCLAGGRQRSSRNAGFGAGAGTLGTIRS